MLPYLPQYILQAIHYPGTSELKWAMEYTLVE